MSPPACLSAICSLKSRERHPFVWQYPNWLYTHVMKVMYEDPNDHDLAVILFGCRRANSSLLPTNNLLFNPFHPLPPPTLPPPPSLPTHPFCPPSPPTPPHHSLRPRPSPSTHPHHPHHPQGGELHHDCTPVPRALLQSRKGGKRWWSSH